MAIREDLKITPMSVNIKRVDKTLPLPKYETNGSVGFDLLTRVDTVIEAHTIELIPANVIVQVPDGYFLMVALRSSTPRKHGLIIPQSVGIVDQDYCGPNDELMLQVLNFKREDVYLARGSRIAQGVFIRCEIADWEEVDEMETPNRGGFGSTGD